MFTRATGSKSKTLIASFGLLIRFSVLSGAHMMGSGSLVPAAGPSAACALLAKSGLAARNCRKRRRLAAWSMRMISPLDDIASLPGILGQAAAPGEGGATGTGNRDRPLRA